jgi:putative methyltransferase (TIGR04325 family)
MSKLSRLLSRFTKSRRTEVIDSCPDRIIFAGHYANWADALNDSEGYNSPLILNKTREALLQVKNGHAVYERDSVLFDKIEHSFPLLAGLLRAALAQEGNLCLVDFGGALGSSYFQCRAFLKPVRQLQWLVVEQPAHVLCGRKDFQSDELFFYNSVEECAASHRPNCLLLSSVLQYLPEPYAILRHLLAYGFPHLLIDGTAFLKRNEDRLTVQKVPKSIYPASYPAWFFSESRLLAEFANAGYVLVADFQCPYELSPDDEKAYHKGFIFEKRDMNPVSHNKIKQ